MGTNRDGCVLEGRPWHVQGLHARAQQGRTSKQAIATAAEDKGIPNLAKYVRRFRAALMDYAQWIEDENAKHMVCAINLYIPQPSVQELKEESDNAEDYTS